MGRYTCLDCGSESWSGDGIVWESGALERVLDQEEFKLYESCLDRKDFAEWNSPKRQKYYSKHAWCLCDSCYNKRREPEPNIETLSGDTTNVIPFAMNPQPKSVAFVVAPRPHNDSEYVPNYSRGKLISSKGPVEIDDTESDDDDPLKGVCS
jgi:hypothetical protein